MSTDFSCQNLDSGLRWRFPLRDYLEIRLHEPSRVLFLSCGPPVQRSQWLPYIGANNDSGAGTGYIATYDPSSKKVTKLTAIGFNSPRGLSPFGMDIVPSTHNPDDFTIYATKIRPPNVDLDSDLPPGIREVKRDEIRGSLPLIASPPPPSSLPLNLRLDSSLTRSRLHVRRKNVQTHPLRCSDMFSGVTVCNMSPRGWMRKL